VNSRRTGPAGRRTEHRQASETSGIHGNIEGKHQPSMKGTPGRKKNLNSPDLELTTGRREGGRAAGDRRCSAGRPSSFPLLALFPTKAHIWNSPRRQCRRGAVLRAPTGVGSRASPPPANAPVLDLLLVHRSSHLH